MDSKVTSLFCNNTCTQTHGKTFIKITEIIPIFLILYTEKIPPDFNFTHLILTDIRDKFKTRLIEICKFCCNCVKVKLKGVKSAIIEWEIKTPTK